MNHVKTYEPFGSLSDKYDRTTNGTIPWTFVQLAKCDNDYTVKYLLLINIQTYKLLYLFIYSTVYKCYS